MARTVDGDVVHMQVDIEEARKLLPVNTAYLLRLALRLQTEYGFTDACASSDYQEPVGRVGRGL